MLHFLSGLPRSGSTLLASILRQNPRFRTSIMSPLGQVVTDALQAMGPRNEAEGFLLPAEKTRILRGIFTGYYGPDTLDRVVFDNNRRWLANIGVTATVFPDSQVVCTLRSPAEIADSFERLFQKNPLALSPAFGAQSNLTVYDRVAELMGKGGVAGFAFAGLRSAYYGPYRDRLVLVEYDNLCRFPREVLQSVHERLGEEWYEYDFDNIEAIPGAREFDAKLNTPGLHDLKPKVVYEERLSVLPPDIWNSLPPPFWRSNETVTTAT